MREGFMDSRFIAVIALEGKALEWAALKSIGGQWPANLNGRWDKAGFLIGNLHIFISGGGQKGTFVAFIDERTPSTGHDLPEAVFRAVVQSVMGNLVLIPGSVFEDDSNQNLSGETYDS
ncbi:hypothetical protein ACMGEE_01405 [Erwinia sp. DT-104]|uniref:hypothetical protein n=1 Tax=Erwinia sp. DT-104 TaxID=3396161 RepID=UPI003F1AC04E